MFRLFGGRGGQSQEGSGRQLPYLLSDEEEALGDQTFESRSSPKLYGKPSKDQPSSSPKPSASTSPGSSTPASDDWSSHSSRSGAAAGAVDNPFRMGASPVSRSGAEASACAAASDQVVLTLVRSSWWAEDGTEDLLKLDIDGTATVAEVKQRIALIYGIPEAHQQLQRTAELGDSTLPDYTPVPDVAKQPIYLLPTDVAAEAAPEWAAHQEEIEALQRYEMQQQKAMEEQEAMARSVAESLQGVRYTLKFALAEGAPEGASSSNQDGSISFQVDALAYVGDVQAMVENQMFGTVGQVPLCLVANGQALPPQLPLHFAGVTDGATVSVVRPRPGYMCGREEEDSESGDSLHDAMLQWACR
mmetsp:Transcript_147220/g.256947  ORF Transcript_147220/g.256947 Transcript_147220/m.256947 type:complete len:360 (-) Transcript_147220:74-1153(-)